jgi:RecA-family ATPase
MQDKKRATEAAPTQCKGSNLSSDSQICHELDDDFILATTEEKDPYLIDLSDNYPEPDYLIQVDTIKTMPKGDVSSTKAKSKNGKSYLESIFVASLLGYQGMNIHTLYPDGTVVYFDTEQNIRNTARLAKRVHILLGWDIKSNNDRFNAYSLRSMPTDERLPYIEKIISNIKPDLVVIDGIADLINDFNNIEESSKVIDAIMKMSTQYNCHVSCVLHTNKSAADNNMKGHLGTLLLQKSSDVYEVKKEGGTFNVTETDSRNIPIEDFSFSLDGNGIPIKTETIKENKEVGKLNAVHDVLASVFSESSELTYKELTEKYAMYSGESAGTAKRRIKFSMENNFLKINGKKYSINN